jgi:hypothetical protein
LFTIEVSFAEIVVGKAFATSAAAVDAPPRLNHRLRHTMQTLAP